MWVGLAVLTLGLGGAVGLAAVLYEPIVTVRGAKPRIRYQTTDLCWLAAVLAYPLMFLTSIDGDWGRSRGDRSWLLIAGLPLLIMGLAVWRLALEVLERRGVTGPLRRGVLTAVALPCSVVAMLVFTVTWCGAIGKLFSDGQIAGELAWPAVASLGVALLCRVAFTWSLRPPAAPQPSTERSPFDTDE